MRKPNAAQTNIGDPTQFGRIRSEDDESTGWDLEPLVSSSLDPVFPHVDIFDLRIGWTPGGAAVLLAQDLRITGLRSPHSVVLDQILKPGQLAVCKRPKLHTTSTHSHRREANVPRAKIRDGLENHVIHIEFVLGQEYVEPARPVQLFACRQVPIRQPPHADVDDLTEPAVVRREREEHAQWNPKPIIFPSLNPFLLHLASDNLKCGQA